VRLACLLLQNVPGGYGNLLHREEGDCVDRLPRPQIALTSARTFAATPSFWVELATTSGLVTARSVSPSASGASGGSQTKYVSASRP
jgi:hypothetical protein